ncbi:YeiH family protein [Kangiella taiwanensis]|uniref:YeiH family protein n=1 Tax=Kangiella taiwanensis TaxID=1079179 RepID=UPI001CBE99D8|nr:putative sulfate exporter family transporter [Kangiella taiwanensis]
MALQDYKNFQRLSNILLIILTILCVVGFLKASYALAAGLLWGWFFSGSHSLPLGSWASLLLKVAIVLLGFTLPFGELVNNAGDSFWLTVIVIASAILLGLLLGKLFQLDKHQSWLISSGTAICGGSAIAAVGSSIKADQQQMVVSLAIVFLLNAVALFVYPAIGHWLELSQQQFGIWAALGIHDTSSVVGAAADYGSEALEIATTAKLARALWIIPVALIASFAVRSGKFRLTIPLFILFFLLASSIGSFVNLSTFAEYIQPAAKNLFALSLLWMGTSLNKQAIKTIPIKAMLLGLILWLILSITTLLVVLYW